MRKKDIFLYALIIILVLLFLWQWLSKGALISQAAQSEKNSKQEEKLDEKEKGEEEISDKSIWLPKRFP